MIVTDHTPTRRADDAAPLDMLGHVFEACGWAHAFLGDDEVSADVPGSWATYQLRGAWRREDNVLQLLCLPDIRVAEDKRVAIHELLTLINEQVWLGHFDVWSTGRVLLFRHALLLGDEGLLSVAQAKAAVEAAVDECDRFYPAFQFILWGNKSPAEALASALVDTAGEA